MEEIQGLFTEVARRGDIVKKFKNKDSTLILHDVLKGADANSLWTSSNDEWIINQMSSVNTLLNNNTHVDYAFRTLNDLIKKVDPHRYVTFQNQLISAINYATKNLQLKSAQKFLGRVLKAGSLVPEISHLLSTRTIPSILSTFPTLSPLPLTLLRTLSSTYPGPLGPHAHKLTYSLLNLLGGGGEQHGISSDNSSPGAKVGGEGGGKEGILGEKYSSGLKVGRGGWGKEEVLWEIFPLLASGGGGGEGGVKHSGEWRQMIGAFGRETHKSLVLLYGTASSLHLEENPFKSDKPEFPFDDLTKIPDVILRSTLLKERVLQLSHFIIHYLTDPFPAPKRVPFKLLLVLVENLVVLNPIEMLGGYRSPPVELVHLSLLIPQLHQMAFKIIQALIKCLKGNFLTECNFFEQITLMELNWIGMGRSNFCDVKRGIYDTICSYLTLTSGFVLNSKTSSVWTTHILFDISPKTKTIHLEIGSKSSKNSKNSPKTNCNLVKSKKVSSGTNSYSISNSATSTLKSDTKLSSTALEALILLIPSLDTTSFKKVYNFVQKLIGDWIESGVEGSPYDDSKCIEKIYDLIHGLILNPNHNFTISVSYFTNICNRGLVGPHSVKCMEILKVLEKIIHPTFNSISYSALKNYKNPQEMEDEDENDGEIPSNNETEKYGENLHDETYENLEKSDEKLQKSSSFSEVDYEKLEKMIERVVEKNLAPFKINFISQPSQTSENFKNLENSYNNGLKRRNSENESETNVKDTVFEQLNWKKTKLEENEVNNEKKTDFIEEDDENSEESSGEIELIDLENENDENSTTSAAIEVETKNNSAVEEMLQDFVEHD